MRAEIRRTFFRALPVNPGKMVRTYSSIRARIASATVSVHELVASTTIPPTADVVTTAVVVAVDALISSST